PALLESQIRHPSADGGPDDAVRAVASQDVVGVDRSWSAGAAVGVVDAHASPDVRDAGHLRAAGERDGVVPRQARPEDALEFRLVEHVRLGEAVRTGRGLTPELPQ